MIYDRLERIATYRSLSPRIAKAIDYAVANGRRADLPVGRHEIDGDAIFAVVHEYETKTPDAAKWEAHRAYIDLQLVLAGMERMDVADIEGLTPIAPFDVAKDCVFFEAPTAFQPVVVPAGAFTFFFPHDAHRPSVSVGLSAKVRKVVVKIVIG